MRVPRSSLIALAALLGGTLAPAGSPRAATAALDQPTADVPAAPAVASPAPAAPAGLTTKSTAPARIALTTVSMDPL
ncbi:murein L,D-transpeptidase, partial [Methylobacterium organophilum]|nr:murein L,D-transpeptidase [Methylobacterium organophilum]